MEGFGPLFTKEKRVMKNKGASRQNQVLHRSSGQNIGNNRVLDTPVFGPMMTRDPNRVAPKAKKLKRKAVALARKNNWRGWYR